jgi:hypothetical protein
MSERLSIVPVNLAEANAFVKEYHRHLGSLPGCKFCIGVARASLDTFGVVGVAIVGRPVARHLDDAWTLEINRLCTDGTKHAPSKLYAACWRASRAMGYRRLITYTLKAESGISLRASGFALVGERRARAGWDAPSRPRVDHGVDGQERLLWEASA